MRSSTPQARTPHAHGAGRSNGRKTLRLTIAYDGTRYAGWQVQKGRDQPAPAGMSGGPRLAREADRGGAGHHKPTIQGTLERVLARVLQEPVRVVGSGRTDAGVHAEGQVAHVRTHTTLRCERLFRSLNQLLPQDIAVTRIEQAQRPFHARFDASRKRYRYRVFTAAVVPPFIRPYVHHVRAALNVSLMRREATALRGRHDFRAFARVPPNRTGQAGSPKGGTRRTITSVWIPRKGEELHLEFEGTGFLHTMVRSMVGTLLDIGRGRLPPGTIRRMLLRGERRLAGTTAPAKGLTLLWVAYYIRKGMGAGRENAVSLSRHNSLPCHSRFLSGRGRIAPPGGGAPGGGNCVSPSWGASHWMLEASETR